MTPPPPPESKPARAKSSRWSRRQWLRAAGCVVLALPLGHKLARRRRRGEPAPTGWFGHC